MLRTCHQRHILTTPTEMKNLLDPAKRYQPAVKWIHADKRNRAGTFLGMRKQARTCMRTSLMILPPSHAAMAGCMLAQHCGNYMARLPSSMQLIRNIAACEWVVHS